jgi:3-phosphoshikimate 1-carboxyvinyltransferase
VSETWAAPTVTGPLDATVVIPGSKSMTNRALVLAALASASTTLRSPLRARDTQLMAAAIVALGAHVEADGADWIVTPGPFAGPAAVDCGLAGTVMRFVPPVAALGSGEVTFDGDPRARERPMGPVLDALRQLGVLVEDQGRGTLPFTVDGRGGVRGGTVEVDASRSSQFVSALLLAGCRYDEGVEVRSVGPSLPSLPHIEMTLAMLTAAGATVEQVEGQSWRVLPRAPRGGAIPIEPDVSNALPFAAAALATGGRVRISGFPASSRFQAVGETRRVLTELGAVLTDDAEGLLVDGSAGLTGADLDMSQVGELVPVVAALACLASSRTSIRGVAHLRGHETDRLAALAKELGRLGADVRETDDGLVIVPRPLRGGIFETYDDHRLATAAALLGLVVPGVQVVDVATTGKTLPGFVDLWTGMLP